MIIFNDWFGRLGNNIIQLCNIIDIALYYKHDIQFNVEHKFFDLKVISDYFSKYNNNIKITDKYNFYYPEKINNVSQNIFRKNSKEKRDLLKKAFKIKNVNALDEDILVIHLRSGDIFRNTGAHEGYISPPLAYFVKKIYEIQCKKIIILCEDKNNPILNRLLQLYKNAVYSKNSLEEDIKIILGAKNIIMSVGTFIPSLLLMSDNIKCVHGKLMKCQSIDCKYNHYQYISNDKELKEYYELMHPWRNTEKQINTILTYKY